jgi:iron complex outermembrane recepter protein
LNYTPEKLKGWSFYAKMLDVMQTNQSGGYTGATANGLNVFQRDWVYDYEGQIIELGVSYTFNQSKEKVKQRLIGDEYF